MLAAERDPNRDVLADLATAAGAQRADHRVDVVVVVIRAPRPRLLVMLLVAGELGPHLLAILDRIAAIEIDRAGQLPREVADHRDQSVALRRAVLTMIARLPSTQPGRPIPVWTIPTVIPRKLPRNSIVSFGTASVLGSIWTAEPVVAGADALGTGPHPQTTAIIGAHFISTTLTFDPGRMG